MGRHKRARAFASIGIWLAGAAVLAIVALVVILVARGSGPDPVASTRDRPAEVGQTVASSSSSAPGGRASPPSADLVAPSVLTVVTVAAPAPAPPVAARPHPSTPKPTASSTPVSATPSATRSRGPIPPIPPRPTSTAVPVLGDSCSPFGRTARTAAGQSVTCRFNFRHQPVWTVS